MKPIVVRDQTTATAYREPQFKSYLANELDRLLQLAHEQGFVITVELQPGVPLAMGNYRMRGLVRGAR